MLERILSGGQTDTDQAAWRAAQAFGVATGGGMPKGILIEDGPRPEFAECAGAAEMPAENDLARTEHSVQNADGTLWFGATTTAAAQMTVGACHRLGKPCLPVYPDAAFEPSQVATWITENQIRTLNVAGNREREEPGIGARVEAFLTQVLQQLGHQRA